MYVHFIAVGGAAMHNLAIALSNRGYRVTGSDDEIFEPSRSRLSTKGLLPPTMGWDPDRVSPDLDAVILGMHARQDNPELLRAQELKIPIYSFPEFLFEQTRNKLRVVIGGSHGKTTVTSMIMHVLRNCGRTFDYMVGAQIEGFDTMVGLSENAEIAVFEGDEYLSSPIDRRPKFHLYRPHVAVINGIAWDHINVFPSYDGYVEQFSHFVSLIEPKGTLIYFEGDPETSRIVAGTRPDLQKIPFSAHPHTIHGGRFQLDTDMGPVPVGVFGLHNMQNIEAARAVCSVLNIPDSDFYETISTFRGASRRLQTLSEGNDFAIYLDFAHSPSKAGATVRAVKALHPDRKLIACLELHTFSSLNRDFLSHYAGTLSAADQAVVYFDPATIRHKKLPPISEEDVRKAFDKPGLTVFSQRDNLIQFLQDLKLQRTDLLMMSSGTFSGAALQLNEILGI